MSIFQTKLEEFSGDFESSFCRLVTVGISGKHHGFGRIIFLLKKMLQKFGRVFLDHYFSFKIHTCRKSPIFVSRASKTIRTAVLTTLVRIHRIFHSQIRTFHFIYNCFRENFGEMGFYLLKIFFFRFKSVSVETVVFVSLRALTFDEVFVFHDNDGANL